MTANAETLQAILAKAREKLAAAERELTSGFAGEAASRAYYAAFHAITAVLAARGLAFASHAQTIGAFNREFVKTGLFPPETIRQLQRLFEDRQTADYDWVNTVDAETAAADVAAAQALVTACMVHVEDHLRKQSS